MLHDELCEDNIIRKTRWTDEEDKYLREAVDLHGEKAWKNVALMVPGRTPKQCRERWIAKVNPEIRSCAWSQDEDELLKQLHLQYGNKWAKISAHFIGRSMIGVKNRWASLSKSLPYYMLEKSQTRKEPKSIHLQETQKNSSSIFEFTLVDMEELSLLFETSFVGINKAVFQSDSTSNQ